MGRFLSLVVVLASLPLLSTPLPAAQDGKPLNHTSADPKKCKKCSAVYDKAMEYIKKNQGQASFPAQMVMGWVFLADGGCQPELDRVVKAAISWESQRGNNSYAQNWYPALAGLLLSELYKHQPSDEILKALQAIADEFVKVQERTGGWFKWFEGAYNERKDYPVKDLGILDAIVFGYLCGVRAQGVKVPEATIQKAEKCIASILTGNGISYGTGQQGGDRTGARGAFAMLGLLTANMTNHRIWKTYAGHLPRSLENMDKGHHVGAFHCLGVTLGCHLLGPQAYNKLTATWLDKLIAKQEANGGVYVGDDGDAGGEKGLLGENHGSTAAFALLVLLQDQARLRPPKKTKK